MGSQSITREQLLDIHEYLTQKAQEVMKNKNHDYATTTDVFRNFRMFGGLGILVRLSDKLARLRSFEENGEFKVADEKLMDTILDTINYAVIYYAYRQEGQETTPAVEIKEGPYCSLCENALADVRSEVTGAVYCNPCRAKASPGSHNNYTLLERL